MQVADDSKILLLRDEGLLAVVGNGCGGGVTDGAVDAAWRLRARANFDVGEGGEDDVVARVVDAEAVLDEHSKPIVRQRHYSTNRCDTLSSKIEG